MMLAREGATRISNDVVKRKSILKLEKALWGYEDHLLPEDFPTKHHFAGGVYLREFHLAKGRVVVGKIHRYEHHAMLIKGKAVVVSEEGRFFMNAPHIWSSQPGVKRVVYAIEDTVFVTVHKTDLTDPDEIVEEMTVPSFEALEKLL